MTGRVRLAAQALAVGFVAVLLGLLVWKLATDEKSEIPAQLVRGETPPAPDFDLGRLDREGRLSLADLRGKAVVLNFWASWCAPCRDEAPELEAAWRRYRGRGVVVLGVNARDLRSDARKFARRNDMTYPLVHDGPGKLWDRYGVTGLPETFFIRRAGRLAPTRVAGPVDAAELEKGIRLALRS